MMWTDEVVVEHQLVIEQARHFALSEVIAFIAFFQWKKSRVHDAFIHARSEGNAGAVTASRLLSNDDKNRTDGRSLLFGEPIPPNSLETRMKR